MRAIAPGTEGKRGLGGTEGQEPISCAQNGTKTFSQAQRLQVQLAINPIFVVMLKKHTQGLKLPCSLLCPVGTYNFISGFKKDPEDVEAHRVRRPPLPGGARR